MPDDFERIEGGPKPTQSDESIEALAAENAELRKRILEDRFVAGVIIVILFDALIFRGFDNWGDALVIGAIELLGLVIVARRCNVQDLTALLDRLIGWKHGSPHGPLPPADGGQR